MQTATGWA